MNQGWVLEEVIWRSVFLKNDEYMLDGANGTRRVIPTSVETQRYCSCSERRNRKTRNERSTHRSAAPKVEGQPSDAGRGGKVFSRGDSTLLRLNIDTAYREMSWNRRRRRRTGRGGDATVGQISCEAKTTNRRDGAFASASVFAKGGNDGK